MKTLLWIVIIFTVYATSGYIMNDKLTPYHPSKYEDCLATSKHMLKVQEREDFVRVTCGQHKEN